MLIANSVQSISSSEDILEDSFKSIFNLIYRDQFNEAYKRLDEWSVRVIQKQANNFKRTSKEERIFNLMKIIKYLQESIPSPTTLKIPSGEERYHFWQKHWALFEDFIKFQSIYHEANYHGIKNFFYQKMIDNLIVEYNSQSYYNPIMLETCKRLLEIGSWDKVEEGLNYLEAKAPKLLMEIHLEKIKLYHYQNKKLQAMQNLKDLLFTYPNVDLSELNIPVVKSLVRELFLNGFKPKEIQIWLGVFLRIRRVLPILYSLNSDDYKRAVFLLHEWEKSESDKEETYNAILVYRYLYVMDQLYTRIVKGKTYLKSDLNNYLIKLKQVNNYIYQQVQDNYETR